MRSRWLWVGLVGLLAGCATKKQGGYPISNPPPERTRPPDWVHSRLVSDDRICGLGIAGRGIVWNSPLVRDFAKENAARNLAGMLRTLVTTAMIDRSKYNSTSIRWEDSLEVDDALVDQIEAKADHQLWFDVRGEGPFRTKFATYHLACIDAEDSGLDIDPRTASRWSIGRQYSVDEVPDWVKKAHVSNGAVHCALGSHGQMLNLEKMYEPLTNSVRAQLVPDTRTWVLAKYNEQTVCRGRSEAECRVVIDSVVQATNEGLSKGVSLTAMWLDARGLHGEKNTAYGWGCIFDTAIIRRVNQRLKELNVN